MKSTQEKIQVLPSCFLNPIQKLQHNRIKTSTNTTKTQCKNRTIKTKLVYSFVSVTEVNSEDNDWIVCPKPEPDVLQNPLVDTEPKS